MPLANESSLIQTMRERLAQHIEDTGISQSRIAKELGVSKSTVSLFLGGTYSGNNLELARNVEQLLNMGAARQATAQVPEICLKVRNTVEIEQTARIAHIQRNIVLIYGPAGCGKSTALKHYASTNRSVVYVEADATVNTVRSILKLILLAMGEEGRGSTADLMQRILAKLIGTSQMLILDEAQHLSERSFDAIRAINNKANIGIVYAGNPSILKRMYGRQAEEFDQVYSRTTYKCCLNNAFTKEDIAAIYAGFGFSPECLDYLYHISKRKGGLRLMVKQCQTAQNIALSMGEDFSVEHLEEAAAKMGIGGMR